MLFKRSEVVAPLMGGSDRVESHREQSDDPNGHTTNQEVPAMSWKRAVMGCTMLISLAGLAVPATPAGAANGISFVYKLSASTHIKKLNQDVTIKNGTMNATVDIATGKLTGHLKLPPATVTTYEAGVGVLTAT